jgi:hypothetical protein
MATRNTSPSADSSTLPISASRRTFLKPTRFRNPKTPEQASIVRENSRQIDRFVRKAIPRRGATLEGQSLRRLSALFARDAQFLCDGIISGEAVRNQKIQDAIPWAIRENYKCQLEVLSACEVMIAAAV